MDLTDVPVIRREDESAPDFDDFEDPGELLADGPVRKRLLDVVLQLRETATVATVAERADCDPETARDYLSWFARIGIVREHPGRPVGYELNRSYLRWRRIERIRREFTDDEIVEELDATVTELAEYRDQFDAPRPSGVSLLDVAEDRSVEEAWEAVSAWKTLRSRAALLDAARRDGSASGLDPDAIDA